MKAQLKHDLTSSFMQWFDHTLIAEGAAFSNYSSRFYEMKDVRIAGYVTFASPFGQLVYDRSVSGADVMSGVYVNGTFLARGQSGLKIDYQRGRVFLPSGFAGKTVSGSFAMKEFDVVLTTQPEDQLVFSSKFTPKPRYAIPFTGLDDNEFIAPVIFVSKQTSNDIPFEFGGTKNSVTRYRALVVTKNDWQLDGVDSIFTAKKDKCFPLLTGTPFDEFGDLKQGSYSYESLVDSSRLVFIQNCVFTKFESAANRLINPLLNFGVLEFNLEITRI